MKIRHLLVPMLLLLAATTLRAQEMPADADLSRRLEQLEAETQRLREQLQGMQQPTTAPIPADPVGYAAEPNGVRPGPSAGTTNGAQSAAANGADPTADSLPQFATMDEVRSEVRRLAWTKGDFSIVPYGILWGNTVWESQRTQVGDYTFYVLPERPNSNAQYHVDGRSTRFGIDVLGPRIPMFNCAQSGGKIEFDFQRNIDTENRSGVLLRHAYVEMKNDEFRLLFGQTWDVISPLNPGMLMYSIGWGAGNIGYRRAQLRGERYFAFSDTVLFTFQGSLNGDILNTTDISGTGFTGEQAGWPVLEGRAAVTLGERGKGCYPMEFGVSGHVGEQVFDFRTPFLNPAIGVPEKTWSLNADWKIPLTSRFGVQGEFFTGANLGAYLGGILQGVDIGTPAAPGSRDPIRTTGGWFDVWYDWTSRLHSHAGYSIDDPIDSDVTTGRIYNAFFFSNITFDVTSKFLIGFEYSQWKTIWTTTGPTDSAHFEFAAKYFF